ncbi:RagB/SusD family nutrient uptake outer membrane protein [Flavobacterium undicola]|uniref:RagB/SusD family nutrient uptake outer membrane protein n=1 Tax=Flavobacterium undicola TaxID=1932779 RepID=UPI00137759AF|nr:RagB/SusD family nutrient uptake outer membrane protein [Flavobacterium undicola]MBA0883581.1 RagB/SusD family nutrient uptake outer membrane protein [Flavobacterium undicola]
MITTIRKTTTKSIVTIVTAFTLLFSFGSCQDYLDVQPEDKLSGDQVYRNVYDADAAVLGIYGKFMGLAEKYVVLNEMRADLMTTTRNSSPYLKQLSQHNVSAENTYINPKQFYEVIQNCNDALKNFDIMLADKKFTQSQYDQRYADIACIRTWIYLQLGIQYGTVPYITEPIETIDDVKNINKYPRLPFDQLLDKLVTFTEALTYKNIYDSQSSLLVTVDGYDTRKFFINKECLLGDLELWKGNYLSAASHYKNVMEETPAAGVNTFDNYRVKFAEVITNEDLAVGYLRNFEQDATTLVNSDTKGWRSIFGRSRDVLWNSEWIWSLPFDSNFAPANPFIAFFSKTGGDYLAKPSQRAMDLWNSNTQNNDFPYDARGPKFTYNIVGGDPVIMKYIYKYQAANDQFKRNGDWFLYRAAKLHLRYAEAANRDKQYKLANALLNIGIKNSYNPLNLAQTNNVTNAMQTKLPFPYDFDARIGDFPNFRAPWHRNIGVRGRAYLKAVPVVGDSLISIENNIINEAALELAYEGNRWEDLVRVARRRNDPAFLADKIFDKLNKEGNAEATVVRTKLMNPNNWYLPFTW